MTTTDPKPPMTKEELDVLFEEEKSCDEYFTKEIFDAIDYIEQVCWLLVDDGDYNKICSSLIDFMLDQGLAQLLVKIIKHGKHSTEIRHTISKLISRGPSMMSKVKDRFQVELCKNGIIRTLVKELTSCDAYTKDPWQRVLICDTLTDLSNVLGTPNAIPVIRASKGVDALSRVAQADNKLEKVTSLRLLSYLTNEKESERLASSGNCMETMLKMVQKAAAVDDRRYTFKIKIDDNDEKKYFVACFVQARGINNLASNDTNKTAIVENGGVPILTALLRPEYSDDEKVEVVETLWKLSFLESCQDAILNHLSFADTHALQTLKQMRSSENLRIRDASQGLLHQLNLVDIHDEPIVEQQTRSSTPRSPSTPSATASPREPPPSYQETMEAPHVMISYKWDQQEKAIRVQDKLSRKSFNVWLDIDKVEAHYAYHQQKPIIPLMVEEDYAPDGWLGMITAMKKYIRAYSDEVLDKDMPALLRDLGNRGRAV